MATYNFLDKTGLGLVWAKIKSLIRSSAPTIMVDPDSATGTAIVGYATTAAPNYTPSGDISLTTQRVTTASPINVEYNSDDLVLIIGGLSQIGVDIPNSASFHGSGVRLINVYEGTELEEEDS